MSLATWKKEFYRTPANRISKRYALRHSIKKWTGLLPINRKRHGVFLQDGTLYDNSGNDLLQIDGDSCALCNHYRCAGCPVVLNTGKKCSDAYDSMIDNNRVTPMINLLKRALTKKGNQNGMVPNKGVK